MLNDELVFEKTRFLFLYIVVFTKQSNEIQPYFYIRKEKKVQYARHHLSSDLEQ